ncbi:long-chain fatty acid--CoA ligase [Solirubrobacter sp. CPCC 204708]|uniref:Acyl-CoA synthetase n=1 Tax=Solirubrobacter deserti TaxID=2282478 RepID=A0ABT4RFM5_9ACTN|nr:AMP-dependent synthetase/ligase [Solirubrobacter deserti]MBE2318071.1 long-chain fatty acid--CoA ligase [Solirubrobacter deserti]MDA0137349.1 AMP-dependent synthetase/ligase [Solirubrobacter deserti]
MQHTTPSPRAESGTGSRTIADIVSLAAERYQEQPAARFKRDGEWTDLSYTELSEIVSEIARGLIDLGLHPGERVALLCTTRIEWTFADFGITSAGGVVVPIYPTNSPEECAWVAGNSESRFAIAEDASQVAKLIAVRDQLPGLEAIVSIEPAEGAISLDEVRERGRARDAAEVAERIAAVKPEDPYTIMYTSGTTGPPKGCVLTHGNYRSVTRMCEEIDVIEPGEPVYLYLPLAHSYALLIQLLGVDLGAPIIFWSGSREQIVPDLMATKPVYLPSVPRIFEKIYTLVTSNNDPAKIAAATQLGLQVRAMMAAGQPVPEQLQAAFDQADAELYANVRNIFGGRLKQATSGAAPIGKEILEFFYACGAPVLEGYGMTETSTVTTTSTVADFKLGTVGRAIPGSELKIAEDGEVLVRGPHIFRGYYGEGDTTAFGEVDAEGWLHTGDLGALDDEGYLTITGRKKDIMITAGGKNLTPANLENDLKRSRWISQAVMHADRRPYPVALITLDPEEIVHFAREHELPEDLAALSREPKVFELIQGEVDRVNAKYAQVEQIKRFFLLDHDLSQETGELTPTLKVKRNVINDKYASEFDALYSD